MGEINSLAVHPKHRGHVNYSDIWDYLRALLLHLDADYVLGNGLLMSRTYLLYSTLGFRPLGPPLRWGGFSQTPTIVPMIASLRPEQPLPPSALDVDTAAIEGFVQEALSTVVPRFETAP
jgi:hypothetical protein